MGRKTKTSNNNRPKGNVPRVLHFDPDRPIVPWVRNFHAYVEEIPFRKLDNRCTTSERSAKINTFMNVKKPETTASSDPPPQPDAVTTTVPDPTSANDVPEDDDNNSTDLSDSSYSSPRPPKPVGPFRWSRSRNRWVYRYKHDAFNSSGELNDWYDGFVWDIYKETWILEHPELFHQDPRTKTWRHALPVLPPIHASISDDMLLSNLKVGADRDCRSVHSLLLPVANDPFNMDCLYKLLCYDADIIIQFLDTMHQRFSDFFNICLDN
ncbi:hypothetical protein SARC_08303 [Sphaeroforma arctica JP610]|uniref:Uncharacterized protein n=1 Tax=Sphaeroforma arctica JP610 TaxID=667725 RepID=A0A0L0FTP1_9EUKA|nr:hypothetical protein SARC_08303 [Sphaeroforma arctica JP610]KNC79298.1 hypothetical protein SARC_08303 [Sphaeroforma arctica JP610]|eukprot:XP_014153200.1 hypothetical protein SARC_08303 [Sphaeroforma arctica JP610]